MILHTQHECMCAAALTELGSEVHDFYMDGSVSILLRIQNCAAKMLVSLAEDSSVCVKGRFGSNTVSRRHLGQDSSCRCVR